MVDQRGEFRVALWSRPGRTRTTRPNEDALLARVTSSGVGLFAVADGVGGHANGDRAAAAVVRALDRVTEPELTAPRIRSSVLTTLESVHTRVRGRLKGAASTAAVVSVCERKLRMYNVGDSGAALVDASGSIQHRTIGHGPAHYALEAGVLEHAALLDSKDHHLVSNVIGMDPLTVDVTAPMRLRRTDTLVLASDGVLDNLWWPEIGRIVAAGRLDRAAERLSSAIESRMDEGGKDDDRSFVLVRLR
jgi:serine/threonine protein phosphatase PrpC